MFMYLAEQSSRDGELFFWLSEGDLREERKVVLSVFFSVRALSHTTANLFLATRGVETNEGLPM